MMTNSSTPSTLVDAFNIGLQKNRDGTAMIFDDGSEIFTLTYDQFAKYVLQVRSLLDQFQPKKEVILVIGDSKWNPVLFIGVMSAGAVFFYQPSGITAFQVSFFLDILHPRLILINNASYAAFQFKLPNSPPNRSVDVAFLDHRLIVLSHVPQPFSVPLAYVVTTSGTTGSPKIVKVPHKCILPNITHLSEIFSLSSSDVVFQCSPLTFDPSVVEIFCTLFSGAALLCTSDRIRKQPRNLSSILIQRKISVLQTTPSLIMKFELDARLAITQNLHVLALGGEQFPSPKTLLSWFNSNKRQPKIYNLYGITEVSSWASCYKLNDSDMRRNDFAAPIGEPLMGTTFELKQNGGHQELCVGGEDRVCLINDEEEMIPGLLRATGDSVVCKKGSIFCVGRLDNQVKRNGKRLNLDEVERVALSVEAVRQSVALWESSGLILCLRGDCERMIGSVQDTIKEQLAPHYYPDRITCCADFPLTSHGKIDRRALLLQIQNQEQPILGKNINKFFSDLWEEILAVKPLATDNFIERGGSSLQAVNLYNSLCRAVGSENPSILDLILHSSVEKVIEYLTENSIKETSNDEVAEKNDSVFSVARCGYTQNLQGNHDTEKRHHADGSIKVLWSYNTKKCVDASPLIVMKKSGDSVVLIGSHSGLLSSLDLLSGLPVWTSTLPDRIESSACVSPCGQFGVVGCYDGGVYFFSITTGAILWCFQTEASVKCSPIAHPSNGLIFIGSHDHHLYALNPQARKCLWNLNLGGSVFASVCIVDGADNIMAASLSGVLFKLEALNGAVIWTYDCQKPVFAAPCCHGDYLYVACVDGSLTQLNSHGHKQWLYQTSAPIFSSPVIHRTSEDHCVLFGCHDHRLHCVSASGAPLWTFSASSSLYASPFVMESSSSSVWIASSEGVLYEVNSENGNKIDECRFPGEVFSSPVCLSLGGEDLVVVGCRNDYVYCVQCK